MKRNKTICLDEEVIESLDNVENASKMINDMLKEHFMCGKGKKIEELRTELTKLYVIKVDVTKEINAKEDQIEKLEKQEVEMKAKFSKIPEDVLIDFQDFPEMTEETLRKRFDDVPYYQCLKWEDVLEAWRMHNGQS